MEIILQNPALQEVHMAKSQYVYFKQVAEESTACAFHASFYINVTNSPGEYFLKTNRHECMFFSYRGVTNLLQQVLIQNNPERKDLFVVEEV